MSEKTGFVKSETDNVDFRVYIHTCRKVGEPSKESDPKELDFKLRDKRSYAMRKKGIVKDFVFFK